MALDAVIFSTLRTALLNGFSDLSKTVSVKQAYQPTSQGVEDGPCIYFQKLPLDLRYGFPQRSDEWDKDESKMVHTETQQMVTTLQINARQTNLEIETASDLLMYAAYILQSTKAIDTFKDQGIGILNISQIREVYFTNDRGQYESSPSFDLQITHRNAIISESNYTDVIEYDIHRV